MDFSTKVTSQQRHNCAKKMDFNTDDLKSIKKPRPFQLFPPENISNGIDDKKFLSYVDMRILPVAKHQPLKVPPSTVSRNKQNVTRRRRRERRGKKF